MSFEAAEQRPIRREDRKEKNNAHCSNDSEIAKAI